jgi:UDP-glucose 4-epimerase
MKSEATDSFYNVGTGQKTTIHDLTQKILEVTESQLSIQFEPAGQTFVKNRVGCPIKAKQELGFSAKVDLEQGLQDLIAWRQAHQAEVSQRRLEQSLAIA